MIAAQTIYSPGEPLVVGVQPAVFHTQGGVSEDSLVYAASLSKQFTAALLALSGLDSEEPVVRRPGRYPNSPTSFCSAHPAPAPAGASLLTPAPLSLGDGGLWSTARDLSPLE